MPTYKIQYNYDTGDSFGKEYGLIGILPIVWISLEIAKENLQRIKEHYEYYNANNNYYRLSFDKEKGDKVLLSSMEKDWYVSEYDFQFNLKLDNGCVVKITAPWVGYFESLNEIELIEEDSDRKISFRQTKDSKIRI